MYHDDYMSYSSNEKMEKLLDPIIGLFEKELPNKNVLEIACGTGNWTQILAKRAKTVLATDINESMLAIAQQKKYIHNNVRFESVNAYDLTAIREKFDIAFAADWWSHIPVQNIPIFIDQLHSKLEKNGTVIIVDMKKINDDISADSYYDENGNYRHKRTLPDNSEYEVIKNYPTERELHNLLSGRAENIKFTENFPLQRWVIMYDIV
jgi:ubiquinone/menaquinone biosynthesis C-methylase UbiE